MEKDKGKVLAIGIDLGTTYSCVGIWLPRHQRVEIITNDQGNRTTPSYVAFTKTQRVVGDAAKNQAALNPINTVFDVKRLIGRRFNDVSLSTPDSTPTDHARDHALNKSSSNQQKSVTSILNLQKKSVA